MRALGPCMLGPGSEAAVSWGLMSDDGWESSRFSLLFDRLTSLTS